MHRRTLCTLITAFAIAAVAPAAQSQVVAPIKPGLWQIHSEREVNGQRQPDMSERMKNMSPEKRAQIDAMMKQHGVASGAGGMGQVCYSRESLERSPWADQATDCKVDYKSRSSSVWKWHTSCAKSRYEADGEADFLDRENYVVKSTSISKIGEQVRKSSMTITAKYLGSDCGGLKPLEPYKP
jgi:hypothetical protein